METRSEQTERQAKRSGQMPAWRLSTSGAAVALAIPLFAAAYEIDTGNPDYTVRWDNTVRLNYAQRAEGRDPKIGNSTLADEGDYRFDRGHSVAQRFDLLSELDVVYARKHGARISGTAWYDGAYDSRSRTNPNLPFSKIPSYTNTQYSSTIQRLYHQGGELLDAFVFGEADLGGTVVRAKLGRHTVYWGESLLLGGNLHGIAYAQNPLDLQKAFATPGVEAKELFRPLNQLSLQSQVTDTLSLSAQYMLQWEPFRYPEGGTYLGPVDFAFNGPDRQFLSAGLGFAQRGAASRPSSRGEWGFAARWSPEWLDGTLGAYYRNFADKLPQTLLTQVGANSSRYNLIYADHIDLYGLSLAKSIAGVSVGAEFSLRRNTPLNSQVLGVAPGMPDPGETKGARGDTLHAVLNALGTINATPLFDTASWTTELTASRYIKVRSGANLFNAVGYAACNGKDKLDGCVTRNYLGVGLGFTPTWFQVLPGVDLSAPITYSVGIRGNAATVFGGNEKAGNYSIGLSADVQQKYRFDLKYIDYTGRYKDNGTAVTSTNGLNTYLKDRGFISLTFKTSF